MSGSKIKWQNDEPWLLSGYPSGKLTSKYFIYGRLDKAYELYKTGMTSLGIFLDLESAKARAEELEANK